MPKYVERMNSTAVVYRSAVKVVKHKYGYRYKFTIKLEDGRQLGFEDYANTKDKALDAGITRSLRMIDHGYREWDGEGVEGGLVTRTNK